MASSSSVLESAIQDTTQGTSTKQEALVYEIRGRTMSLEECDLHVQVERPIDFTSLALNGCNIKEYYESQDLIHYFNMLNGPTYENLVRNFWVRASVYDKHDAKEEMDEKILIDPSLARKSREEMGLEPFVDPEIRSSIMGIPVFISQAVISYVMRRVSKGNFKDGMDNNKKSPWNDIVKETMFINKKKGSYSNLSMEKRMMLKIQNENLLPKGGGSDQPSLEHTVFLHFFINKEKENMLKYIFKHMVKTLRESQLNNRTWIPYGRFISEILYQGGILKALKHTKVFTDQELGTVTFKIINGSTLGNMRLIKQEVIKKLDINMKDAIDVQLYYIDDYLKTYGEEIHLEDIPEEMYGGALPVAKSRKTKRKLLTEAEYLEEASEQPARKAKKAKKDKSSKATGSEVATIQEEVEDLEADKILPERTRSGKVATTSQSAPKQPSIPKRKRKNNFRKLKESRYVEDEDQIVKATNLVNRELKKNKIVKEASIQKALKLAKQIEVPASNIVREDAADAAQEVIKAAEVVQELAATEAEGLAMVTAEEAQEGNTDVLEAPGSSEAPEGISETLHTDVEIVELGSSSPSDIRSNSPSSSSSTTSSDPDDIPLSKVYSILNKALPPSPSTKTTKKHDHDTFVPMYPSV